jgi:Flp pilus assembly pilin Flp
LKYFVLFILQKMFYLFLWLYTLSSIVIWWFFIVARIHAYKFKNFSPHIKKVTFALTVSLIALTLLWYILLFSLKDNLDGFWTKFNDTSGSILENIKKTNTKNNDENIINYDDL